MFAGLYPTEAGVHAKNLTLDTPQPTIAERLSEAGWTCRGFSANGNVSPSTDFDRGFDEFTAKGYHSSADIFDWQSFIEESDDNFRRYPKAVFECVTSDCDTIPSLRRGFRRKYHDLRYGGSPNLTVEDALDYVRESSFGSQEFLFLNLMEAHSAYVPPEEYQTVDPITLSSIDALVKVLEDEDESTDPAVRQTYNDSVEYLSDHYRLIHETLLEDFEYIITVSDHGETFGEEGVFGHVPSLVPELVQIPLNITGDVNEGNRTETVSTISISQTISEIAGVEEPPRGQTLFDSRDRQCLTESHGLSRWQRRELQSRGITEATFESLEGVRRGIAFDNYYGYETSDNFWTHAKGRARSDARRELEEFAQDLDVAEQSQSDVSGAVQNELRDLGYI